MKKGIIGRRETYNSKALWIALYMLCTHGPKTNKRDFMRYKIYAMTRNTWSSTILKAHEDACGMSGEAFEALSLEKQVRIFIHCAEEKLDSLSMALGCFSTSKRPGLKRNLD